MSILPITDGNGKLLNNASFVTIATMLFPNDEKKRESFLAAKEAEIVIEEKRYFKSTEGFHEWLESVLQAPAPDKLKGILESQAKKCEVAGNILLYILNTAAHESQHASVRKAVYILGLQYARSRSGSPRWINTTWSEFKPVAHLCAALNFWLGDLKSREDYDLGTELGLPKFLALAEGFRKEGESHYPPVKHQRNPVSTLPTPKMWSVPPDFVLPTVERMPWPLLPD